VEDVAGEHVLGGAAVGGRIEDVPLSLDHLGVTLDAEVVFGPGQGSVQHQRQTHQEEPHDTARPNTVYVRWNLALAVPTVIFMSNDGC